MNKIVRMIAEDRSLRDAIIKECAREGDPLTVQALIEWRKLQRGVPPARVHAVSRATGLPPHIIRPDVFKRTRASRS